MQVADEVPAETKQAALLRGALLIPAEAREEERPNCYTSL